MTFVRLMRAVENVPHVHPALHAHADRPGRARHPQDEDRVHLRRRQRQRIGQIEDAQQSAEYNDVLQQEADFTAGHGILRTTGLIAISAEDPTSWNARSPTSSKPRSKPSCETRRLWGEQAQGFSAAALPLCRAV